MQSTWTSSTARRRTSTASHHALRGRPPCPLRSENGTVRKKQAHTGGLSRLLLRPAGPCGWQAPPSRRTDFLDGSTTDIDCFTSRATRPTAPCGPPPDTWPRLVVGGRRAGSPPASSSPSTALCGPPPGVWPRLGVGWWCVGSPPASSSPSTALCGPPPGTWTQLGVGWRRVGSLLASSSPSTALCGPPPGIRPRLSSAGASPLLLALTYGRPSSPLHSILLLSPHPILYLPFSMPPHPSEPPHPTLAPFSGTHPQPAHTYAPLVPSAEETKLCSTVVSTNAI